MNFASNSKSILVQFDTIVKVDFLHPFGMQMPGRQSVGISGAEAYRYAYNGMEHDGEVSGNGNSYTTEFRQYDPRLGRWKSLDPQAQKYPDMSPYNVFGNNPVLFLDPLGDTIAIFAEDGTYLEWKDDSNTEWTGQIDGTDRTFTFADPINDPAALKEGKITRLVFVSQSDIESLLVGAGAFDPNNHGALVGRKYMAIEGKGGELDLSTTHLKPYFDGETGLRFDYESDPNKSNMLFLVEGESVAHNHFNFGNFLVGASGEALGVPLTDDNPLLPGVLEEADINAKSANEYHNGYDAQEGDSPDDQYSITLGYQYAQSHSFEKVHSQVSEILKKRKEDAAKEFVNGCIDLMNDYLPRKSQIDRIE